MLKSHLRFIHICVSYCIFPIAPYTYTSSTRCNLTTQAALNTLA